MIQTLPGPHGMTSRFDWDRYAALATIRGWEPSGLYRNAVPISPAQRAARLLALRIKAARATWNVRAMH